MTSINSYQNNVQANYQQQKLFKKLDANNDGSVSKDEFVNGRPKDVTADQAGALFDKLDTKKTGSLSESDFANAVPPPGGLDPNTLAALLQGQDTSQSDDSSSSQDDRTAKLFAKLDSDGNGTISKDEFVNGRPKDVTEDQAASLYDKIDTEGSNALTADQLKSGLAANRPHHHQGGGISSILSSTNNSTSNTSDNNTSTDNGLQTLLNALQTAVNDEKNGTTTASGDTTAVLDNFLKALKSYSVTADSTDSKDETSPLTSA